MFDNSYMAKTGQLCKLTIGLAAVVVAGTVMFWGLADIEKRLLFILVSIGLSIATAVTLAW